MEGATKTCTKCGIEKPLTEDFFFKRAVASFWRQPCKVCWSKRTASTGANKAWHIKNAERSRDYLLRRKFGITLAQYRSIEEKQKGRCAICNEVPRGKRPHLVPDHNHENGRVRGLLCTPCNTFLGRVERAIERLDLFVKYLERTENGIAEIYG